MGIRRLFTEHPASVGETYFEHLCAASGFAIRMLGGAIACFLHALLPFAFRSTGSDCISALHEEMIQKRRRLASSAHSPTAPARVSRASAAR
jgi:Family of unknown function (DUF6356)